MTVTAKGSEMKQPIKIFLLILIVCAIFGGVLWGNSALHDLRDGSDDASQVKYMDSAGRGTEDPDSVTIVLTGNLFCDRRYQSRVRNEGGGFDFAGTLEYVKPILMDADLAVGNLETCISGSNPYSMDLKGDARKKLLNAPPIFLEALKNAGFNGLVLSSEHNCDFGKTGIRETLDEVNRRGFYSTGLYSSPDARHYMLFEAKGFKIAILSYTGEFNESADDLTYEEQEYMLSRLDTGAVIDDIADARKAGAEYVIVYVNKGPKRSAEVTDSQKETLRTLSAAGADYVIGSEGLILQRPGSIKRNGVRVRAAYSMGTFVGYRSDKTTRETAILKLKISRNEDGSIKAGKGKFIPCYMSSNWRGRKCVLIPEGTECGESSRIMLEEHYKNIRKSLKIDK